MKNADNILKISCECNDTLKLEEMTELQGNLKARSDDDVDKIIKSIKKYGFSFPFFIWKHDGINHCLDGHGRIKALYRLKEMGFLIPPLPVVYVDCKDKIEAKEKLLRLNSQYGKMSVESVLEFVGGEFELNAEEIALPDTMLEFTSAVVEDKEENDETNLSDTDFNYKNQYGVIVICNSEQEQENVYNRLSNEGYTCKVVTV